MSVYPTRFAVLLVAAGAPLGIVLGMVRPDLWVVGLIWVGAAGVLMLIDAIFCAPARALDLSLDAPSQLFVGRKGEVRLDAGFSGWAPPRAVEFAIAADERLALTQDRGAAPTSGGGAAMRFSLSPMRRGTAALTGAWLRWRGPLGLVWRQKADALDREISILPNIAAVKDEAIRLFARNANFGVKIQRDMGEGAEFHALREWQVGMDRRSVDWKQSARHSKLLAKEHHTERNHHIIFAIDCGRAMSEPVAGAPRLDRAINAALLLAFTGLKLGDKAGLFAFDSKVRAAGGVVSGIRGFGTLQNLAAKIDYSHEETNFTLGLSTLDGQLERRSLIILFTDFPDTISAELMIENVGRLLKKHIVVFVALRDVELDEMMRAPPSNPQAVSRAVTAAALLRERETVLVRLRHLGAEVLDAPLDQIGPALVNTYLSLKKRNVL